LNDYDEGDVPYTILKGIEDYEREKEL